VALIAAVACGSEGGESGSGGSSGIGGNSGNGGSSGSSGSGGSAGGGGSGGSASSGGSAGSAGTGGSSGSGTGQVLFSDDFESGNLDTWDSKDGQADKYRITNDPALVHGGSGALDITIRSDWSDGQLNKWFSAVDELHLSMHVMFAAGWDQSGVSSRHLMQLSGNHTEVMQWGPYPDSSFGKAGVTPDGTDFFWIHLTPWNDDAWHVGMAHPDQSSMWGDSLQGSVSTTPGSYQHVVLHGKLNDLGAANGFVRLTIDGVVAVERTGVEWRTVEQIVFNSAGFQAYYQDFPATSHVYVDDFVVREGPP
jgi:hypothetical protein